MGLIEKERRCLIPHFDLLPAARRLPLRCGPGSQVPHLPSCPVIHSHPPSPPVLGRTRLRAQRKSRPFIVAVDGRITSPTVAQLTTPDLGWTRHRATVRDTGNFLRPESFLCHVADTSHPGAGGGAAGIHPDPRRVTGGETARRAQTISAVVVLWLADGESGVASKL